MEDFPDAPLARQFTQLLEPGSAAHDKELDGGDGLEDPRRGLDQDFVRLLRHEPGDGDDDPRLRGQAEGGAYGIAGGTSRRELLDVEAMVDRHALGRRNADRPAVVVAHRFRYGHRRIAQEVHQTVLQRAAAASDFVDVVHRADDDRNPREARGDGGRGVRLAYVGVDDRYPLPSEQARQGEHASGTEPAPDGHDVHRHAEASELSGQVSGALDEAQRHAVAAGVQTRQEPHQDQLDPPDIEAGVDMHDMAAIDGAQVLGRHGLLARSGTLAHARRTRSLFTPCCAGHGALLVPP